MRKIKFNKEQNQFDLFERYLEDAQSEGIIDDTNFGALNVTASRLYSFLQTVTDEIEYSLDLSSDLHGIKLQLILESKNGENLHGIESVIDEIKSMKLFDFWKKDSLSNSYIFVFSDYGIQSHLQRERQRSLKAFYKETPVFKSYEITGD
ncbi:MAG: hypothetical protein WCR58_07160 [Bacteroidales bacterium]|jgi:hypothetical protein|nr:hypothetical protein [Bacteroidales bacterium]MDD3702036.1 hypothetical protein [Bacteroidales bacterium]MDY0369717.1 hypothetical protein [Bacteroidales bacterium]